MPITISDYAARCEIAPYLHCARVISHNAPMLIKVTVMKAGAVVMVVQTEADLLPKIVQMTLDHVRQNNETPVDLSFHLGEPDPMPEPPAIQ